MNLLIAGIGNVGVQYQNNRHNIGFLALDAIAAHYGAGKKKFRDGCQYTKLTLADIPCHLIWPQNFVNLSGLPIKNYLKFYKTLSENLLVIHDDLDVPPGTVKVKLGGGHGGHNGLKDIDGHVGKMYWRLRIGIGHPGHRDAVTPYVLSDFAKQERLEIFAPLCEAIAKQLPLLLGVGGITEPAAREFLQSLPRQ